MPIERDPERLRRDHSFAACLARMRGTGADLCELLQHLYRGAELIRILFSKHWFQEHAQSEQRLVSVRQLRTFREQGVRNIEALHDVSKAIHVPIELIPACAW